MQQKQSCNDYKFTKMEPISPLTYLTMHGVKPSVQRLAVMDYLLKHRTHPTADEIYSELHQDMPTLSKTTVYNTLKLLTEQGAAKQLTIDERHVCFDAVLQPHAHFFCTRCGKMYDVQLRDEQLEHHAYLPKGFSYDHAALYFRGCCKACATAEGDKSQEAEG